MLELSTWALVITDAALLIIVAARMRFARRGGTKPGLVPMAHLRERSLKSSVTKRSVVIAGQKTSVSLEEEFWNSLKEIASERGMTPAALVAAIDGERQHANLSSAIRLFVLSFYRDQRR